MSGSSERNYAVYIIYMAVTFTAIFIITQTMRFKYQILVQRAKQQTIFNDNQLVHLFMFLTGNSERANCGQLATHIFMKIAGMHRNV